VTSAITLKFLHNRSTTAQAGKILKLTHSRLASKKASNWTLPLSFNWYHLKEGAQRAIHLGTRRERRGDIRLE